MSHEFADAVPSRISPWGARRRIKILWTPPTRCLFPHFKTWPSFTSRSSVALAETTHSRYYTLIADDRKRPTSHARDRACGERSQSDGRRCSTTGPSTPSLFGEDQRPGNAAVLAMFRYRIISTSKRVVNGSPVGGCELSIDIRYTTCAGFFQCAKKQSSTRHCPYDQHGAMDAP